MADELMPFDEWMQGIDTNNIKPEQFNGLRDNYARTMAPLYAKRKAGPKPRTGITAWNEQVAAAEEEFNASIERLIPRRTPDSFPTKAANIGRSFLGGATGATGAMANVFGDKNAAARYLDDATESLQKGMSQSALIDRQRKAQDLDEAEQAGTLPSIWENVTSVDRYDIAGGAGSLVPTLATGLAGRGLAAGATAAARLGGNVSARTAANVGNITQRGAMATAGAAGGIGGTRNARFDQAKALAKEQGWSEEQADAIAMKASEMSAAEILAAGGLGALTALTGAEKAFIPGTKIPVRPGTSRFARTKTVGKSTGAEAITEGAQSGLEGYGANVGAIEYGLQQPGTEFKGVAGQAAAGATIGAALGAPAGAYQAATDKAVYVGDVAKTIDETKALAPARIKQITKIVDSYANGKGLDELAKMDGATGDTGLAAKIAAKITGYTPAAEPDADFAPTPEQEELLKKAAQFDEETDTPADQQAGVQPDAPKPAQFGSYIPSETGSQPNTEAPTRLAETLDRETGNSPITIEAATALATEHEKGYTQWAEQDPAPDAVRREPKGFIDGTVDNILATAYLQGMDLDPAAEARGKARAEKFMNERDELAGMTRYQMGDRTKEDGTLATETEFQQQSDKANLIPTRGDLLKKEAEIDTTPEPVQETQETEQVAGTQGTQGMEAQPEDGTAALDSMVGGVVEYGGYTGTLTKTQNGYYVAGQLVESGESGQTPAQLGVIPVSGARNQAVQAGEAITAQAKAAPTTPTPAPTDLDQQAETLVAEMEDLFGVEMANAMIDAALKQLGGGKNFQQQIEAIRNEYTRQLEAATTPSSQQTGGTDRTGGAGQGQADARSNESQAGQKAQEVTPAKVPAAAPAAADKAKKDRDQKISNPNERYGRDGTPFSEGGKPFKTKLAAQKAKKLQPSMRVVPVKGGFALADKTPAQLAAEAKAAKRIATGSTGTKDAPMAAHELIAMRGGLAKSEMKDAGFDRNVRVGSRFLFAGEGKGMTIAKAAEMLQQYGFTNSVDENAAYDLIRKSTTNPQYTPEGYEQIAQAEQDAAFEDYLAAQQEAAPVAETLDDAPGIESEWGLTAEELAETGYSDANAQVQAEIRALVAMAESMGIDADAINENTFEQNRDATDEDYYAAAKAALKTAIEAGNGNRREDSGQASAEVAEAETLTAPTKEDILAKESAKEKAEAAKKAADAKADRDDAKARERREIAKASEAAAGTFELGQNPLDSLTGQKPMFSMASKKDQTETAAFKRWFGDSKVVDAEGNPLVVYHGTKSNFYEFDMDRIGVNGLALGPGFYFAESESLASGYGDNVMQVYLKAENPTLSAKKRTITKAQTIKIIDDMERLDEYFLSNYGDIEFDGRRKVLDLAIDDIFNTSKSDADIIGALINVGGVERDAVMKSVIERTGKDGFVADSDIAGFGGDGKLYTVLLPAQIKSATENQGTFDPTNPDIRQSQGTTQKTGNTTAKVNATLKEEGLDRNNIKVVQSTDQVADGNESVDINGVQGFYNPANGEVTLVADSIPEGKEAGVALHEVFHRAEEAALTDQQRAELTQQVKRWALRDKKTNERKIFDAANKRAKESGDEAGEFLAYAIEEARNMGIEPNAKKGTISAEGWLAKVKKYFTAALEKLAPTYKGELSADDLVDIAYGVAARDAEIQEQGKDQTETAAFKSWFGDSVVTENGKAGGKPLVVYHGTAVDFTVFDGSKSNARSMTGVPASSFVFSSSPEVAGTYAGRYDRQGWDTPENQGRWQALWDAGKIGEAAKVMSQHYGTRESVFNAGARIMPVYLSVKNPLIVDADGAIWKEIPWRGMKANINGLAEFAKRQGHDGLIVRNVRDQASGTDAATPADTVFVFNPTQIKSAIGNQGTFDPANPDIRYSRQPLNIKQIEEAAKTGKLPPADRLTLQKAEDWMATRFVDSTRPHDIWARSQDPDLATDLIRRKNLAPRRIAEFEKRMMIEHGQDIARGIGAIAKRHGLTFDAAKELAGDWMSARYAPVANQYLMQKDQKELTDAISAATANPTPANKAAVTRASKQMVKRAKAIAGPATDPTQARLEAGVAGGYTDAMAKKLQGIIEQAIPKRDLEALADMVYDLNAWKLQQDLTSGRVTQAMVNQWPQSRLYVPLTGDPRSDQSEGTDMFGTGSVNQSKDKAIGGRTSSLAQNAIDASFEQVDKAAKYHGWEPYKESLHSWYDKTQGDLVASGMTEQEAAKQIADQYGITRAPETMQRPGDNNIIYRKGGESWVYDLGNQDAVAALKSSYAEPIPTALKGVAMATRFIARNVTQFLPGFGPLNMVRDAWEKSENIRTRGEKLGVDMNQVARDMLVLVANPTTLATTAKAAAEGTPLESALKIDPNNADQRDMKEFLEAGGAATWGDFVSADSEDLTKKLEDALTLETSKGGWGITKTVAKNMVKAAEVWNNTFELKATFAAYQAMTKNGIDKEVAAEMALELMNFGKGGTAMKPIKALYMFAQPIATGGQQMYKTLKTPRGRKRFLAMMIIGMGLYGMLRSGYEDEESGENLLDNESDFLLERNIPVKLPGMDTGVKIPVGFGVPQLAWGTAINLDRFAFGNQTAGETVANLSKLWVKTMAPVSPSEASISEDFAAWLMQSVTPTIGKPVTNIALNRTAFGGPLNNRNIDDSKAKALQGKRNTAQEYKDFAEAAAGMGVDMTPEEWREISNAYLAGPVKEFLIKPLIEGPNREQINKTLAEAGRETAPVVSTTMDRFVYGHSSDAVKQRLFYRYRDEMQDAAVDDSLGKELSPRQRRMLDLFTEVKKEEGSARSILAHAAKSKNPERMKRAQVQHAKKMIEIERKVLTRVNSMRGLQ